MLDGVLLAVVEPAVIQVKIHGVFFKSRIFVLNRWGFISWIGRTRESGWGWRLYQEKTKERNFLAHEKKGRVGCFDDGVEILPIFGK